MSLSPASPSPSPSPLSPADSRDAAVAALRAAGCVFAEEEADLLFDAAPEPAARARLLARRVAGQPLEHVIGRAEFRGLRVAVDPGVFVPRRRTEFLVERAAAVCRPGAVVVDLCCGSGALGAALAAECGPVELHAADVEPAAVRCARRNVAAAGGRVYRGDLFDALPDALRGRVDVLLANVPYVPSGEVGLLPAEAREYEPRVALDGGADGLDVLRRVAAGARGWLAPAGVLLFETSDRQTRAALGVAAAHGLVPALAESEEWDARVISARMG